MGRCIGTQSSGTKSSRISMFLCCRWWNSRTSFDSSSRVCRWVPSRFARLPSRLSTCPKSHKTGLSSAWLTLCVNRRRRNSWWKCLRSYPILLCTGMWSSSSTFQFLIVMVAGEVFKIHALDRIQQRFVEQITLNFQFRVLKVFKVSSRDRLLLLHLRTHLVLRVRILHDFRIFIFFSARLGVRTRAHPRGELMACPWRSSRTSLSQ